LVDFTNLFASEAEAVIQRGPGGAGFVVIDCNDGTHGDDGGHLWFTFAGDSAPTGVVRVKSHGAPHYWYFDTDGKGDFLAASYFRRPRDLARDPNTRKWQSDHYAMPQDVYWYTVNPGSLRFNRCCPAVMCWSPSYDAAAPAPLDKFANGMTFNPPIGEWTTVGGVRTFVSTLVGDVRFGSSWQGVFVQARTDLFYSPPRQPCVRNGDPDGPPSCGNDCRWKEDDGTGSQADLCEQGWPDLDPNSANAQYYAHRPLVEARAGVPTWPGSGAPPDCPEAHGITFGEMTTAGTVFDGFVILPPPNAGPYTVQDTFDTPGLADEQYAPWGIWLRMQSAICRKDPESGEPAPGRWVDDTPLADVPGYVCRGYKNVLGCWMCGSVKRET
jgi:hypothetical protein